MMQALNVTRSENLLAELNHLLDSGRRSQDGLSFRRQRSGNGIHAKHTLTTCCTFLLPIFDHFYRKSKKVRDQLKKFHTETSALLNQDRSPHEQETVSTSIEEMSSDCEEKLSYSEVAALVQAAIGTSYMLFFD